MQRCDISGTAVCVLDRGVPLSDQNLKVRDTAEKLQAVVDMAERVRHHDWAATPLGLMTDWPISLKTVVGMMLAAPNPMVLLWGPLGVLIYNDGYARFAGDRHPALLGRAHAEAWPEIAAFNDENMRRGLAGEAWSLRDQELVLDRHGTGPEPAWMDLDYTPVPDDSGRPAGVMVFVTETTERLLAKVEQAAASERLDMALSVGSGVGTWDWNVAADRVVADARFARIYGVDPQMAAKGAPLAQFFQAIHPDDAPRVQGEIATALSTGELFRSEYRLVGTEGDLRWVAAEGRALKDTDGAFSRFPGVTFDITDRKGVETRQAALIVLDDTLAELSDPTEIGHAASRILGQTLSASRVGYGVIDPEAQTIDIARDWTAEGQPSVAGQHRFSDYGTYVDDLMRGEAAVIDDIAVDPRTRDNADALRAFDIGALMDVPVVEAGRTIAQILVHCDMPRNWTEDEVTFTRAFAERTRAVVARREGQAALRDSQQELQRLTDSLPLLVAFVDTELRYRFLNQGYQAWFGIDPDALKGRPVRELTGEDAFAVMEPKLRRALAGERVTSEQFAPYNRGGARYTRTDFVPRRDASGAVDGFYAVIQDISERREAEIRQQVLLDLNDAIRDLTDPTEIAHASSRILAEALDVSRVGYGVMDTVAETVTIERDYNRPGVQSIAGVIHFRDFGNYVENLVRGEVVVFADGGLDPRVDDGGAALDTIKARALINLPLMEQGRVVALLFVNNATPRHWSDGDVALVREVAERVRTATERARAIVAIRDNEARLRFLDDLNVEVAKLTDADAILECTTRMTARHLGVTNCAYADMDADQDGFTIRGDWAAPGTPSIVGHYQLADFGRLAVQELSAGRPLIINDNLKEIAPEEAATFQAIGISATICMPLVKAGRLTALMAIHHRDPHLWTDEELVTIREVTERSWAHIERVRADAALRDSEERYRTLFESMDEGFCILQFTRGADGRFDDYVHIEANDAYTENAGIPDIVGKSVWEVLGSEAPDWIERFGGVLTSGEPIRFEQELQATGRWLELAAFRIEPPERNQVAVIFKDLTARRAGEVALRESEARLEVALAGSQAEFERLWDLTPDLLTVVTYDGRLERINPSWTRVLGHSEETLLTRPYAELLHPDEVGSIAELLEQMKATEQPVLLEDRLLTADGQWRTFVWNLSPEPGGERLYGIGRDVTEERAQAAELAKAHEALRQSQKMEAVGQLTGGIAHDFNNLLAGISGALELLSKRLAEGRLNGMGRYIDAAQGSAERAASLTQRLLAFSRRQTLDPKPTDVNRLIGGMEDLIRRSVGPNVEVEVVGAGGLWNSLIDQPQLENALLNLCINARDAMAPDGGRLTIETANKWLDERHAKARDLAPGQYISLCVTDTGTGMPPEVQAQAFDPFFTTKPLGQGTGLGLSMIHGFVRQSGGQVRIYSEMGEGTTMCLYLPRFGGELEAGATVEDAAVAEGGHGETVLVIDDEETVRMLVAEVLGEAGYHVIEAPDGPSGLDILRSDRRIDLLVSDVGLPGGMNGRQVADAARVDRPDLKVLFITGYAENAAVGNGLLAPGMEVLTKPFVMSELALKVHEMIEG